MKQAVRGTSNYNVNYGLTCDYSLKVQCTWFVLGMGLLEEFVVIGDQYGNSARTQICIKIVNFRLDGKTMLITVSVRCI